MQPKYRCNLFVTLKRLGSPAASEDLIYEVEFPYVPRKHDELHFPSVEGKVRDVHYNVRDNAFDVWMEDASTSVFEAQLAAYFADGFKRNTWD